MTPKGSTTPYPDWNIVPLRSLIRHIVERHHAYLQTELPALDKLIGQIAQRESGGLAWTDLRRAVQQLHRDMELQMRKEETILFPAILELEAAAASGRAAGYSQFGSVANLLRVAAKGHDDAARTLDEIRRVTNDLACEADGEPAAPGLFRRLAVLAADLHRHIHLEKDILFPRAIDLERGGIPWQ